MNFKDRANIALVDTSQQGDGTMRGYSEVPSGQSFVMANGLATSGTGAFGNPADCSGIANVFTMVVTETGSPSTHVQVKLEGSLDGTTWYQLIAAQTGNGATAVAATTGTTNLQARYLRANVTVAQLGGTSPTATVLVAASL